MPPCSSLSDPFNLFSIARLCFFFSFLAANVTSMFLPGFLPPVSSLWFLQRPSVLHLFPLSWLHLLFQSCLALWICLIFYLFYVSAYLLSISLVFFYLTFYLPSSPPISKFPTSLCFSSLGFPSFPSYISFSVSAGFSLPSSFSSGPTAD